MSKSKYNTIKELPFAWYEVDALEAWLDEQSRQGLKMVDFFGFDFGRRRAVFMETNELPTRYRIHIKPKDGYYTRREEYKETMRELGWEYVGQLHYRADIYRAARPDAVEINTDENALRESIKAANRGELCAGIVLILLIPWLLRNELRYMKFYDGFYDMLLDGTALLTAAAVFMAVFYLVLGIYAILRSIAQRRRYLLDRSFRPGPEIHKRKRVRIVLLTLAGISVMFLVVLGVGAAGNYYDVPLSNCPVVMLESLSPEEAAQLDYDADRLDAPYGTGGKSLLFLCHLPAGRPHHPAGRRVCGYRLFHLQLLGQRQGHPYRIAGGEILCREGSRPRLAGGTDQGLGSGHVPPVHHKSPAGVPQRPSTGHP